MRTLVFSDIHHRYKTVQRIIDSVPHDNVILLGDYFDSYYDLADEAIDTAKWLKEKVLHNPKITPLIGNHDASYIWNNNFYLRCSGYGDEKNIEINKILNDDDKSKFKVYHIAHNHVFSHAGLTNPLWKYYSAKFDEKDGETKLEFFDRVLSYYAAENVNKVKSNQNAELFAAGWERGGGQQHGGINWVDWDYFAPINGINQVVGHSIHNCPQICIQKQGGGIKKKDITDYYIDDMDKKEKYLSLSYGLDTQSRHYMLIEDGDVNIFHIETNTNLKDIRNIYLPESPMSGL